jgi:hypothetical protein
MKQARRWLPLAILSFAVVARAAEPGGIVVLGAAGERARERILVDTLRIYTRDLGRSVRTAGSAPATLDPDALEAVAAAARDAGDEVVVWFGERDGASALYALRVATLDLRETAVEPDEPLRTARTLALKVRALLTTRDPREWSVPPEAKAVAERQQTPEMPRPTPTPSPTPTSTSPTPTPAQTPTVAPPTLRAPPPPRSRDWIELTAEYGVTVPTEPAWFRHGLTVRIAVPWRRWPLVAFVDAAFTTAPSTTIDGNTLTARIWPLAAGVELRLRRPRWQLAGGPRASLQIVDAEVRAADGRVGSTRLYSAGLGLLGEVAWLFSHNVGLVGSISAEVLVPRLQLAAGGPSTSDLGWVQFGVNLGACFSVP